MKRKVVTVELRTDLNNNDLKNLVRSKLDSPDGSKLVVDQIQVNLIKLEKK